jgi:hypothetical protein
MHLIPPRTLPLLRLKLRTSLSMMILPKLGPVTLGILMPLDETPTMWKLSLEEELAGMMNGI